MTYQWQYKLGGREDVERAINRFKGYYRSGIRQHVGVNGSHLLLSDDALSQLERLCKNFNPKLVSYKAKPYNGRG